MKQRGVTLIELLVAVTIGLILTLAIVNALVVGEAHKRTTSAMDDVDQSGIYAAAVIDQALRGAGAGFLQPVPDQGALGCHLNAAAILPAKAFPAPFDTFLGGNPNGLNMAAVLIAKNQSDTGAGAGSGSDVLMTMSGSDASGGVPRRLTNPGDAQTLIMDSILGIAQGDWILVSQPGQPECLIEPVATVSTPGTLTLGNTSYTPGPNNLIATLAVSVMTAYVTPLGNPASGNLQFQLFGVGANNTLYGYDLLQISTPNAQALASNVLEMHALYGMSLNANSNGALDTWVDPGAAGYDIATMMANPAIQRRIVAIRIALVLKSSLLEKNPIQAAAPSWFADLAAGAGSTAALLGVTAPQTLAAPAFDSRYRYRVIEIAVPVRNLLLSQ